VIDVLIGVMDILKADATITNLIGEKVFGEEIPRDEIVNLPSKMIAVVSAGGVEKNQTSSTISARFDIWCYGETKYEARLLSRAAYDALKTVERVTIDGMLIHSVALSGGPHPYRDPDTGWPAMIRSVSVIADDRSII